ncbi:MAG: P1 family peptidase [Actinomycetota bacterium]|jgi:L-aminopeptidase/D-esterase-like protein|nr:P1 family peptidase [Actinomycetota bacterium]MDQ3342199.1 P1 family peptidase [Actinomycetota bacterium]MDQ3528501.1 P1 family peptidase [Actinomycetota bacterium]
MALGVQGVRVGTWTDPRHPTGCTVVLPPQGSLGAASVRGGAPGTREAAALGPNGNVTECHAVVLSGGSAFGLATADGVVAWCDAHGIGYDKVVARVPIVGAAIVFDLRAGVPRPGRDAGWAACEAATEADPPMGSVGVGAGCTVGKTAGLAHRVKGGQGWAVASGGGITVGALLAVNALGDVLDERGEVLAGSRAPADAPRFPFVAPPRPAPAETNTVIGCLVTDGRLSKHEAARAADLANSGIARAVSPAHTTFDGDALFLLCAQRRPASVDLVAHLGAQAVAAAIRAAVRSAKGIDGAPADPRATPGPS